MKFSSLFARTGVTSPFGKLDARVDAFRVNGDVLEAFNQRAAAAGMTTAEYLRMVMEVVGFGREHVVKVHRRAIDRVGDMLEGAQLQQ